MALPNLLFIDTNIWLDFYRAKNETGLQLLERVEKIAHRLIITFQLESEFKKNRQSAIVDGLDALKEPSRLSRPGIFSNAKATHVIERHLHEAEKRVKKLRDRLLKALENPAQNDPVYQVCQRIFQKNDDLTLTRNDITRRTVRRAAMRRFMHGCPPRKQSDTSYGDAINWEWMIRCAAKKRAGLVIVSRDTDYGITVGNKSYVNDELRHEFSDKVSQSRKLVLYTRLSDALKSFDVPVSKKEEEAEKDLVSTSARSFSNLDMINNYLLGINFDKSNLGISKYLHAINLDKSNLDVIDDYVRRNWDNSKLNNLAALAASQVSPQQLNSIATIVASQVSPQPKEKDKE
ncbi:MAG: PIN domain-containing protein [Terriglobales bacterium]